MDSLTLTRLCRFSKCFLGTFPSDKLPSSVPYPSCLIVNTMPSWSSGEHWMGIFINKEGYGDVFCSYGSEPKPEFVRFMVLNCCSWNYNRVRVQGYFSTTCGQYAVFFIFCRTHGLAMHKFIELFSSNYEENDAIVTAFINGKFNVSTRIFDASLFQ